WAIAGSPCARVIPRPTRKPRRRLKKLCRNGRGATSRARKDKAIEIWFQDEARIGQQGTLTRVWAKRGTRPRPPRDQRYEWAYVSSPARSVQHGALRPLSSCQTSDGHRSRAKCP